MLARRGAKRAFSHVFEMLRRTLSRLNYSTYECIACGWIGANDNYWNYWKLYMKRGGTICEHCRAEAGVKDNGWPILCQECSQDAEH